MAGKRWNGSSHVDVNTKKRWNGSAWVDVVTAKRWSGSAWIDLFPASALTFTSVDGNYYGYYTCDGTSCELTKSLSDTDTYTISGGTAPYMVSAVVTNGPFVNINTGTPGEITVSTVVGRDTVKEGEIKVTVTDSSVTPNVANFYIPFYFEYYYTINGSGPPFEPEYPAPEQL